MEAFFTACALAVLSELTVPTVDIKMLLKLLQLDLEAHPLGAPVAKVQLRTEPIPTAIQLSARKSLSGMFPERCSYLNCF